MKFKYAESFIENKEKWIEFDLWLEKMSEEYPEEFSKEIYQSEKFQVVGTSSTYHAVIFVPHPEMPNNIKELIEAKLLELWPPD